MPARPISEWTDGVHWRSGTPLSASRRRHLFELKYPAFQR
jgi:hypothetical protein